jgi:hypothetical protein
LRDEFSISSGETSDEEGVIAANQSIWPPRRSLKDECCGENILPEV